ncbi:MAG: lipid II:glycine glycyltransferase FemX [Bacilli bacterium]
MKFLDNLDSFRYEEFVLNHSKKSHFMQSFYFGEIMKTKNFSPCYVGMEYDGKLVATALLLKKQLIGDYCYFYCPRGYVLDFNNIEVVSTFTNYLKNFGKLHKALFIKIDPDISFNKFDKDGNIIGSSNNEFIHDLKKLGYKHKGFSKDFVYEQPRFTFRMDLNKNFDDIYKMIHPTTRKILNKGNQYNLDIYVGGSDDIDSFYETMEETSKREGIRLTKKSYYLNFYNTFHEKNMSDLYIIKVKINNLIATFEAKIIGLKNEETILKTTEYKNLQKRDHLIYDLEKQIEKAIIDLNNIKKIDKKEITLSSIMIVKYGNKAWTVHGGNSSLLRELNSNYLLYYSIISDIYNQGYKCIDFFGTSGEYNPSPENPIFGIHSFKKRLGGEYMEFVGEFDLILNKPLYFGYQKLIPFYRKFKK